MLVDSESLKNPCETAVMLTRPPAAVKKSGQRGEAWLARQCSRNPHDEAVVVRRAQLGAKPGLPLKENNERGWKGERCPGSARSQKDVMGSLVVLLLAERAG